MPYASAGQPADPIKTAAPVPSAAQTAATPPAGFFNSEEGLLGSSNSTSQAAGVIGAGQAQGIAGSDLSMASLMNEIGLTGTETAAQSQYNTENEGLGLAGIGISNQQNALSEQSAAAQGAETQALFGLTSQQTPESLAEAATANKNAVQQNSDSSAINGTLNTQGNKARVATQAQNYGFQQADINRSQAEAAIQNQYSAGDIARSEQGLALTAAANGLSVQQLKDQFSLGQTNLGTSAQGSLDQLYTQYLGQQSGAVSDVAAAGAEEGLLTPGSILSTGQSGGLNLNSLFPSGVG